MQQMGNCISLSVGNSSCKCSQWGIVLASLVFESWEQYQEMQWIGILHQPFSSVFKSGE